VSKVEEEEPKASQEAGPPVSEGSSVENWIPVVPLAALPKGERRVIMQDGETVLLLWYKDQVFAIENRSPAEGAYSEGLLNAKLTQVLNIKILSSITTDLIQIRSYLSASI
jgi:Rieske-like [2Fe-2S] domain